MFGNIRAGRAVLSLTGRQFNDFMKVLESYDKTAGAGQEAFNKQIATTKVAFESLSTQATKTMITIGADTSEVTSTIAKLQEAVFKGFADADKWARWSVYILAANYAMGLLRDSLSKLASGGIGGRVTSITGKVKGDVHSAHTGVENVVDSTRRATSATADLHRQWLAVISSIDTAGQRIMAMHGGVAGSGPSKQGAQTMPSQRTRQASTPLSLAKRYAATEELRYARMQDKAMKVSYEWEKSVKKYGEHHRTSLKKSCATCELRQ